MTGTGNNPFVHPGVQAFTLPDDPLDPIPAPHTFLSAEPLSEPGEYTATADEPLLCGERH